MVQMLHSLSNIIFTNITSMLLQLSTMLLSI